jgi:integrase
MAETAPGTARHVFSEARAFFRWCVKRRLLAHSPLEGLDPPAPAGSRDRVLSDHELQKIWSATEVPTDYHAIIRICMLTGLRRGEAAQVQPSWLKDGVLTIPRHVSKNGLARSMPIPPIVLPCLARCPFSSNSWSKNKVALDKASGVTGWVVHDLRRSWAHSLQRLGVAQAVIEELLGHTSHKGGVIGVYQRYNYWAEQQAATARFGEWFSTHIAAMTNGEEPPMLTSLREPS